MDIYDNLDPAQNPLAVVVRDYYRARVAELEAGIGEPVAWLWEEKLAEGWERVADTDMPMENQEFRRNIAPLFTTPQPTPTVQAAVAAALRKAADTCQSVIHAKFEGGTAHEALEAILALPHDDSALREICIRVADEAAKAEAKGLLQINYKNIVDRVLGEVK